MNRVIIGFLLLVTMCAGVATAYSPGTIQTTAIASTATANSLYLVSGSKQPQNDIYGNRYSARSWQLSVYRTADLTPVDFWFCYSNTVSATSQAFLWKADWGPLQADVNPPREGIFIGTTPTTAGTAGDATAQFESK